MSYLRALYCGVSLSALDKDIIYKGEGIYLWDSWLECINRWPRSSNQTSLTIHQYQHVLCLSDYLLRIIVQEQV